MKKWKNNKREVEIMTQYLAQRVNEEKCGLKNSELYHVYKYRYSDKKYDSFEEIKSEMKSVNGKELRILSHNSWSYTCAYRYFDDDNNEHIVYHSKDKRMDFRVFSWLNCVIKYSEYTNRYYSGI